MKRLTLLMGILIAASVLVAQPSDNRKGRAHDNLQELRAKLDLTDQQVEEWKAIKKKYKPELEEIRKNEALNKADRMRAAADVIDKVDLEINSLLSNTQRQTYREFRNEMHRKRNAMRDQRKRSLKGN